MTTKREWAERVAEHLDKAGLLSENTTLVLHARKDYYEELSRSSKKREHYRDIHRRLTHRREASIVQRTNTTSTEFYALDWMDLDWSKWKRLSVDSFSEVSKESDLYRIRHQRQERQHLEYIGESGDTRRRIQSLARGVYADEMLYRDPHTAAPCLWAVQDDVGSALEVSYTTPPKAEDDQEGDRSGSHCPSSTGDQP